MLLDEPSMGLAPQLVYEVYDIIRRLNADLGVSILLAEQNARMTLTVAHTGYLMEQGRIVLTGCAEELVTNDDVGRLYFGGAGHSG
jgi:branched-chain amino acid transport system ATP-binding protein